MGYHTPVPPPVDRSSADYKAAESARVEKELQEASQTPAYKVPDTIFNRFAYMQLSDGDDSQKDKDGVKTFKVGDLQEYRYPYARAWVKNGWYTHEDKFKGADNIHQIIHNSFDPVNGRFMHPGEIAARKDAELER